MAAKPKTKAARRVEAGEWVEFGGLAVRVGEAFTEDGMVYMQLGPHLSEFNPEERVRMHYDD